MDELVDRVSSAANIEPETARKALAMILAFLQKEGPPAEVGKVLDALPGARTAATGAAGDEAASGGGGGFLGGLMGGGGGLMGLASQLSGIGLGMGEMQTVGHELFAYVRQHVGEDTVGTIAGSIPGLSQFV